MPVEARWLDDERQIVIYEFVGQWSIEELRVTFAAERAMIASAARPIAYISDFARSTRIPLDIVIKTGEFIPQMDPSIPSYVVYADTTARFMTEAVLRFCPQLLIRFADNLEDARKQIEADMREAVELIPSQPRRQR